MKADWLSRQMKEAIGHEGNLTDVIQGLNWSLRGNKTLGMPQICNQTASKMLISPKHMREWESNVLPNYASRLITAVSGKTFNAVNDFILFSNMNSVWSALMTACGADSSKYWISFVSPGLEQLSQLALQAGLWVDEITPLKKINSLVHPTVVSKSSRVIVVASPDYYSGATMTEASWQELCCYCEYANVRLMNVYSPISDKIAPPSLCEIASKYSQLSWLEVYSTGPIIGGSTGWGVNVVAGSEDFICDMRLATKVYDFDSCNYPIAAGVLSTFESSKDEVNILIKTEQAKLKCLRQILVNQGLKLVSESEFGYFTLWQVPRAVNEETIANDGKKFDQVMIEQYGVGGRPFRKCIAYSALDLPDLSAWKEQLSKTLSGLRLGY